MLDKTLALYSPSLTFLLIPLVLALCLSSFPSPCLPPNPSSDSFHYFVIPFPSSSPLVLFFLFQPGRPLFPLFFSSMALSHIALYPQPSQWQSAADTTPTQQLHALTHTHTSSHTHAEHACTVSATHAQKTLLAEQIKHISKLPGQIGLAPNSLVSQSCAGGSDVIRALAAQQYSQVCHSRQIRYMTVECFSPTHDQLKKRCFWCPYNTCTPPGEKTCWCISVSFGHFHCVFLKFHQCTTVNLNLSLVPLSRGCKSQTENSGRTR